MLFLPLELTPVVGNPRIAPANLVLIVANFLLFFLSGGWPVGHGTGWYTALLYGFSHVSLWHLVFNMWALWVFGNPVNRRLGDGYYLLAYLGTIVAIGLIGWLFCSGVGMMGASGGVFAVMTIAMLLMPGARLLVACVICFPITVLAGLISPPKQYWLYWFIRAGTFALKMYWCLLLIPLLLALEWLFVRIVLGVFGWGTAAHLLGMVCGVAIVLALPTRITMPGRRAAGLL